LGWPAGAAYLRNVPQTLRQPDGKVFRCLASGDEFYNWLHDENGYVIIQDPDTGFYVYAVKVNGDLLPSRYVAGRANPKRVGLEKDIRISPERLAERMRGFSLTFAPPDEIQAAPKVGTINNIAIFIRFSDESEFGDPYSTYESLFNSAVPGHNSMHNYFEEVSYYCLAIDTTFYPTGSGPFVASYQDSNPRAYYKPYNEVTNPIGYQGGDYGAERTQREHTLLKNAVDAVASQVPSELNVDENSDGLVDNVCFIIRGSPTGWASLLWPHKWSLTSYTVYVNSKRVDTYNFQLESWMPVGVLCHEMFHSLGSPDLYHYDFDGFHPVEEWDLMGSTPEPPQHTGAYMKCRYCKWIADIPEITSKGYYALNPLTSPTGNCYKVRSPNSTTDYFVLEYRRQTGTFESSLPGSGLLVYRINTRRDGMGNAYGADEVYLYRPDGTRTTDGNHYCANFSSDVGRTAIDDSTNPSCFLSDGNPGGLIISDVGSAGDTISFCVATTVVDAPVFSPDGGFFTGPQLVTITCPTEGAVIHYTTTGADPIESDPIVSGSVLVDISLTLKARAYKPGWVTSPIKRAVYRIPGSIPAAKSKADNTTVDVTGVVTRIFGYWFYIESEDRSSGIGAYKYLHGLTQGMKATISGNLTTSAQGERYVQATSVTQCGSGTVDPIMMNNHDLGGGDWRYNPATGAGQMGVKDGYGLNNVGLLVTLTGRVTYTGATVFYIDDGSELHDNSGRTGIKVAASNLALPAQGYYVKVTGITSCFAAGADFYRYLRVNSQSDIVPLAP